MEDTYPYLVKLGLSDDKIQETIKNENLTKKLNAAALKLPENPNKNICNLTWNLVTKAKNDDIIGKMLPLIISDKIMLNSQLDCGLKYLTKLSKDDLQKLNSSSNDLMSSCGVGKIASKEEITKIVNGIFEENINEIQKLRYKYPIGKLLGTLKNHPDLTFSDGKVIKDCCDEKLTSVLGPKTEGDLEKKGKNKKNDLNKPVKKAQEDKKDASDKFDSIEALIRGSALKFHKPGDNSETNGYVTTNNTKQLIKEHLIRTKGQVKTRFPPEPNGILHIGHAKAINFNFGYARAMHGTCNLRYDDTNPEKEEEAFFRGIREDIEWLGYKPDAIYHASDYFDNLYNWAIELINNNLAYICHQKAEDLKGFSTVDSPWRDRPVEESLSLFIDMKNGKFEEGELTLRMKHIMEDGKKDPVAYRIKYCEHAKSKDKWCIYPTYDFTHCLCDSIEDITHSLCTKEFQARRSSYYWLCNAVNVYCPVQWEYGRLNLQYTVVSKRKIGKLIENKLVDDWDDPRLFTLSALRRRGIPPEAVNLFCARVGVTMAEVKLESAMLDSCTREVLNTTVSRTMVVLEPLKINILNYDQLVEENYNLKTISVKNLPVNEDNNAKSHEIKFSKVLYIEKSDFINVENKDLKDKKYKRLTKTQTAGLKYIGLIISFDSIVSDNEVNVTAKIYNPKTDASSSKKPKGFIHWVAAENSVNIKVNAYKRLFKSPDPESNKNGYVSDVSSDSKEVFNESVADRYIINECLDNLAKTRSSEYAPQEYLRYQFERNGYYCLDRKDSTSANNLVFNKTIGLRESS